MIRLRAAALAQHTLALTLLLVSGAGAGLLAQDSAATADSGMTAEEFEATLGYTTGRTTLSDGLATLDIPASFRFLDPKGSKRLLEVGWGNPEGSADDVLGMLVPAAISPLADSGWAVVISYDEQGYIDDKDAHSIDYTKLLHDMQEATGEANKVRADHGYEPVTLVGWAEPPTYDSAAHKLYWAKELQFGTNPEHTLNYNVRVLGRRGVLVLNAVSGMKYLAPIKASMPQVISFVEFNEGHRYTDFVRGKDKVAAVGIAGLIAGAVATKAGFFKVLLTGLLAAKKLVLVGLAALAAAGRRLLTRLKGEPAAPPSA